MNAALPDASRRAFLGRLFAGTEAADSRLAPVTELGAPVDAVIWAMASDDHGQLFVAGDHGMVFRRDDTQWCREAFPGKLPVHALCFRGERLYSVGWLGLLCERVDGAWHRVQGGGGGATRENLPLFDIAADASGDLWAVGDRGRVVQFDGETWCEHDCGSDANLRSVLPLEDGRVLVAGAGGTALLYQASSWSSIDTGTGCPITGLAALGEGAAIAVGGEYCADEGGFRGRIFLYREGSWDAVTSEHPLPRLRRVRRRDGSLLICGDEGTAFRWTGAGARRLRTKLRYDLQDVIDCGNGILLCGDGGTLLQETREPDESNAAGYATQRRWQQISGGETRHSLRALWPLGEDELIAAGDGGCALHIRGECVELADTPGELRIHDLWGSSPRNVFAACDRGTVLHFDGDRWTVAHRSEEDAALLAITGFGPHDIFAVGDSGHALRYDGLMWRRLETGVQQELYGLWGQDSRHLLAVGGGGLVLRWNGAQWKSFSAGTDYDLYGICGRGLHKLFLAGLSGTLVRFEDNNWHRDFSGVRSDLHAVAHIDECFYAIGSNGTVLRNSAGAWETEETGASATLLAVGGTGRAIYAVGGAGTVLRRR